MMVTVLPSFLYILSATSLASSVMIMAAFACSRPVSTISSTFDVIKYVRRLYIALSRPKSIPAIEYMIRFMPRTTLPTGQSFFLFSMMATVSVPSKHPPNLMMIPTPSPSITPPKHTASMVSEVAFSRGLNISTNTENTAME